MIISIDVGIKNFGLYITTNEKEPVYLKNLNLQPFTCENTIKILKKIFDEYLNKHEKSIVLIEQQLPKNFNANKLSAYLEMFFKTLYENVEIIFCNSKNKGIKNTSSYKERKLCSVEKALEYFQEKDLKYFEKIKNSKKKDDMADAVCQLLYHFNLF